MDVFKRFVMDQWGDNAKEMVAAHITNLAGSRAVKKTCKSTCLVRSLVRVPVNCCADTDEVANKFFLCSLGVGVRGTTRQSLPRMLVS